MQYLRSPRIYWKLVIVPIYLSLRQRLQRHLGHSHRRSPQIQLTSPCIPYNPWAARARVLLQVNFLIKCKYILPVHRLYRDSIVISRWRTLARGLNRQHRHLCLLALELFRWILSMLAKWVTVEAMRSGNEFRMKISLPQVPRKSQAPVMVQEVGMGATVSECQGRGVIRRLWDTV